MRTKVFAGMPASALSLLIACASLGASVADAEELIVKVDTSGSAVKAGASKELRTKLGIRPGNANPYLSFLPEGTKPDYGFWRDKMSADAAVRQMTRKLQRSATTNQLATLPISEAEPAGTRGVNDSPDTAQAIAGFGTGDGDDSEADVSGSMITPSAPGNFAPMAEDDGDINKASPSTVANNQAKKGTGTIGDGSFGAAPLISTDIGPFSEDDGDITKASATGAAPGNTVIAEGEIGDGPFGSGGGSPSGDFDVFAFNVTAPQLVQIAVNRQAGETVFDPVIAIIDPTGAAVLFNDDNGVTVESALNIDFTCPVQSCTEQTYYLMVGGYQPGATEDIFLTDTSDSSTGPGAGSEGLYEMSITMPIPASGDFDFYAVSANAGDILDAEVDTANHGAELDPILALYDSSGNLLALNDDDSSPLENSFDSRLFYTVPTGGTYYFAVGGYNSSVQPTAAGSFLSDPFDSSTGPGSGSQGDYDVIIARNNIDNDFYSISLDAGDVIGMNATGTAPLLALYDANESLLMSTQFETSGSYPTSSPLPGGGSASLGYLVPYSGTFYVAVGFGEGSYDLELRAFRPPQEATGIRQKLFLDFDGARIDTSKFGVGGTQPRDLSPLSSFLDNWGLDASDEDAVIDAIIATVVQNLDSDLRLNGNNPDFDIQILNSRDHPDTWGEPDTSRIIVGGTIDESGISTIGIAQSIDIGNFDQSEDSLVLLDLLSAPDGDPNSLNSIPISSGTIVDLIGVGVGNVVAHEAGHFFANYHTNNANSVSNLQDSGGNLPNLVGTGPDGSFGTGDDVDVDFVVDEFAPEESFEGMEDTKNALAYALTASNMALPRLVPVDDVTGDGIGDIVVVREGSVVAEVRSGTDSKPQGVVTFFTGFDATPVDAVGLPDLDGNGVAELAVLASRDSDGRIVAEIRNLTGPAMRRYVWFARNHTPLALRAIDDDADNNGVPELAALSQRDSDGRISVEVKNAFGPTNPNTLWFMKNHTPIDLEIVADKDNDGVPEVAVLSSRDSDGRNVTEVKNAAGPTAPSAVWFVKDSTAIDLAAVDDKDNDGVPEVAVLSSRDSDGRNIVEVKNAAGPAAPSAVWFSAGNTAIAVGSVDDADNNGVPEVAVLAVRDSDGRNLVEVKNAAGATNPNFLWYTKDFTVRNMHIIPDSDGDGVEEAQLLMIRDSDGRYLVEGRNAAGPAAPKRHWFSP